MINQNKEWEYIFSEYLKSVLSRWNKQHDSGVSVSQGVILEILRRKGKQNISELSEQLEISLSAVTSLSDKLVKSKLVRRVRSSGDRRVVYLEVTEIGLELSESIAEKRREAITKIHNVLTPEEVQTMLDIYIKINKSLNS